MKNKQQAPKDFITLLKEYVNNPFLTDDDKMTIGAIYVVYRHCLTDVRHCRHCPIADIIGCSGRASKVESPYTWGINLHEYVRKGEE